MNEDAFIENLYLKLYEVSSEMGHYLEPDNEQWYLPEWMVSSLATTLFLTASKTILGEAVKDAYKYVKETVINGKTLQTGDTETVLSQVRHSYSKPPTNIDYSLAEAAVHKELAEAGFSDAVSRMMASKTIEVIRVQLTTNG